MGEWDVVKQTPIKSDPWNVVKVTEAQEEVSEKGRGMWKHLIPPRGTGAMAMGSLGTVAGAPLGPPGMIGGGAIGAAGGEAIEQLIRRFAGDEKLTSQEAMKKINLEAAFAGGSEMGTAGMGNLLRPFAKRMGPMAQKIATIAKQQKLPMSPSAISPTKTAKVFEWFGDILPTGKLWGQVKRKQLSNNLMRMVEEVKGALPVRADKVEAGMELGAGIKEAKVSLKSISGTKYKAWEKAVGASDIQMAETAKVIEKNADSIKKPDARAMIETFRGKGTIWTAKDVDDYQKQIWGKLRGKYPNLAKDLQNALKKDIGEDLTKYLEDARSAWADFKTFESNPTVKTIVRKYATDAERVILEAFRSGNLEDVTKIKNAVDENTWKMATSRFVENILDTAVKPEGNQMVFRPMEFIKNYEKYQRQILNAMPEIYENINNFYLITKASVQDLQKMDMGFFGKGWQAMAAGGMATGAGMGQPLVLVPAGFSAIVAKSLMNPKGWLKTWLTEGARGIMPEVIRQGPRIGGRALGLEFDTD